MLTGQDLGSVSPNVVDDTFLSPHRVGFGGSSGGYGLNQAEGIAGTLEDNNMAVAAAAAAAAAAMAGGSGIGSNTSVEHLLKQRLSSLCARQHDKASCEISSSNPSEWESRKGFQLNKNIGNFEGDLKGWKLLPPMTNSSLCKQTRSSSLPSTEESAFPFNLKHRRHSMESKATHSAGYIAPGACLEMDVGRVVPTVSTSLSALLGRRLSSASASVSNYNPTTLTANSISNSSETANNVNNNSTSRIRSVNLSSLLSTPDILYPQRSLLAKSLLHNKSLELSRTRNTAGLPSEMTTPSSSPPPSHFQENPSDYPQGQIPQERNQGANRTTEEELDLKLREKGRKGRNQQEENEDLGRLHNALSLAKEMATSTTTSMPPQVSVLKQEKHKDAYCDKNTISSVALDDQGQARTSEPRKKFLSFASDGNNLNLENNEVNNSKRLERYQGNFPTSSENGATQTEQNYRAVTDRMTSVRCSKKDRERKNHMASDTDKDDGKDGSSGSKLLQLLEIATAVDDFRKNDKSTNISETSNDTCHTKHIGSFMDLAQRGKKQDRRISMNKCSFLGKEQSTSSPPRSPFQNKRLSTTSSGCDKSNSAVMVTPVTTQPAPSLSQNFFGTNETRHKTDASPVVAKKRMSISSHSGDGCSSKRIKTITKTSQVHKTRETSPTVTESITEVLKTYNEEQKHNKENIQYQAQSVAASKTSPPAHFPQASLPPPPPPPLTAVSSKRAVPFSSSSSSSPSLSPSAPLSTSATPQPVNLGPTTTSRRTKARTFAQKLMDVLLRAKDETAVAWLPDGKSFVVVDPDIFVKDVLPHAFHKECKYSSFTRKLNRWGFVRMTSGTGTDCFAHELFQRDRIDLVLRMRCRDRGGNASVVAAPGSGGASGAVSGDVGGGPSSINGLGEYKAPSLVGVEKFVKKRPLSTPLA